MSGVCPLPPHSGFAGVNFLFLIFLFFGLNCCTIYCNISCEKKKKNNVLSRLGRYPFKASFSVFFSLGYIFILFIFEFSDFTIIFHFFDFFIV